MKKLNYDQVLRLQYLQMTCADVDDLRYEALKSGIYLQDYELLLSGDCTILNEFYFFPEILKIKQEQLSSIF
jgi:hypothetical protein